MTSLDRKTIFRGLSRLRELDLIEDTGERAGRTKGVVVYRFKIASSTENGTAKPSQKRDTLDGEAVPFFPRSSTVFPSKQYPKRHTEPKGTERNRSNSGKKFIPPSVEQVAVYCRERGNQIDAEHFVSYYSSVGWRVGRNPMKDWKAAVRTWERNGAARHRQQADIPVKRTEF